MRVAISTDGDYVSPHFGRCPSFTIVDIEDGKVIKKEMIENPGHQPGFIPQFLHQQGVDYIICGGMGSRAKGFFDEFGIQVIVGVNGNIKEVLNKFLIGTLKGGESLCKAGAGKNYGVDKSACDHSETKDKTRI
ncbi:MAG: NifB/NifX family molybdenum-iron cluster-binding protein [bacterium]